MNSLEKENRLSVSPHSPKESNKSFLDFAKFWSNFMTSKITETFSDKISSSNERSFEDKCLTTFNRSLGAFHFEKSQNFAFLKTEEGKKYKKILAYHYDYGKSFGFGLGHEPFEAACCKEKRCFITNNRSIIPLKEFDAVLVHFRNIEKIRIPEKRPRHQHWIFYEREPPLYSSKNPQHYEGIFNWTMTYRKDSDIVASYGNVYKKADFATENLNSIEKFSYSLDNVMKMKNKMVSWLVSNCNTPSKRGEYVRELQKFIPVDIYGRCGPLKCGQKKQEAKCYKKMEKEYKFYLSFENNFCKDYVTEKFYRILNYYIIPVVRGAADYASIAPPHSYINVEDFKTPKELANHLIYLDKNDTAYMEYFNWKKDYFLMNRLGWLSHAISFCTLCQKLHSDKTEKIYYNLTEWFLGEAQCNKDLNRLKIPSSS
ncbi:UNVERIFIED_CONTAM: hypothetical protein RMT77_007251 [Armadillidium vulgare]